MRLHTLALALSAAQPMLAMAQTDTPPVVASPNAPVKELGAVTITGPRPARYRR